MLMASKILTQSRLKELIHYNPDTGFFTWIARIKGIQIGSKAGCVHKNKTNGYRHVFIGIDREQHKAHRLAFLYITGDWPKKEVDHEDQDGTNNKWSNLRDVSHFKNQQNMSKPSDNTSGVVGVCWHKTYSNWTARIKVNGKQYFLGCFKCFNDAVIVRKMAEYEHGFHKNHGA